MREETHAIVDPATFRVLRAIIEPADTSERNSGGAQGAGLERDIEIGTRQPLLAKFAGGRTDDGNFGMGGDVVLRPRAVTRLCDDLAIHHQHRADGHFTAFPGGTGLGQRDLHKAICHRGTNSS